MSGNSGKTYKIGVDSYLRNMLTYQQSEAIGEDGEYGTMCNFTISELEVWKVKMVGGEKKQK